MDYASYIPERLLRSLDAAELVPESEIDARVQSGRSRELTAREKEALTWISHGLGERETAELMGIKIETVKLTLKKARYRLRTKNTAHAACEAIRRGLIP